MPEMPDVPKRKVLIDTPATKYMWEPSRLREPGHRRGISGTHTALLAIAVRFASSGWSVFLCGSVVGPPLPGMTHCSIREGLPRSPEAMHHKARAYTGKSRPMRRHVEWLKMLRFPPGHADNSTLDSIEFDLTIISNVFPLAEEPAFVWNKVNSRSLAIIMEGQFVSAMDCGLISRYVAPRQHRLGGHGDITLSFVHLSEWSRHVFRENIAQRSVQDVMPQRNKLERQAWQDMFNFTCVCQWALDDWVEHPADAFRNPVDVRLIERARQLAGRRNMRSMLYPACWERGSLVAASVFAALKAAWGTKARATFAYYDPGSTNGSDMKAALKRASAPSVSDARVRILRLRPCIKEW